jgi:hypothetical protein
MILILAAGLFNVSQYGVFAMDRSKCNKAIVEGIANGTISSNDSIFFRQHGEPMLNLHDIGLTIEGCEAKCGAKFDWYSGKMLFCR